MTWALLGILGFTLIVVLLGSYLFLQSVSQSLTNALSLVERVHTNDGKRIDQVLDRLMATDFESFKQYQLAEEAEVGGQEFDEEEAEVRLEVPGITLAFGAEDERRRLEEAQILREDFPDQEETEVA